MTSSRQWATVAAVLATLAFGVALTIKLRPQIDLIEVGSRAPNFPAVTLPARTPMTLVDAYRGKVVLLNIWATWCAPCRIEMPSLERLQRQFAGTDFHVVAISVDKDGPEVVETFVKELGLSFDILHDQTADVQRVYQTTGVPESFLIDRDGVIIKKVIGAIEWDNPVNTVLVRRLLDAR